MVLNIPECDTGVYITAMIRKRTEYLGRAPIQPSRSPIANLNASILRFLVYSLASIPFPYQRLIQGETVNSGDTFAHYEIIGPIGRGAMGEVFSARDTRLGREVAFKVLPADFATDPERLARFRREAKVLAALNHTNIAAIHGLEEDQDKLYLAMELAPGETLEARIDRGAMPTEDALAVAVQIAAGLEEAHAKGIVHRDLKPANVKLSEDGRIKILDFGLARAYQGEE